MNEYYQQPITTYEGFSINPAYQTPAYMSNFRPAYAAETDPYNSYAVNRGYFQALHQQYLFGDKMSGYEGDPAQEDRANNWAITTMHRDAAMNAVTKVGVPVASWYLANKILSTKVGGVSPTAGLWDKSAAFSRAIYQGQGLNAARAAFANTAARQSLGGAASSVLGRMGGAAVGGTLGGAARMLGVRGAFGAGVGMGGAVGATVGGALGAFLAPMAVASLAASGVNKVIAEPYVGIRRGEDAMLANTANTYVGRGNGPNYGQFGISAMHANRLSSAFMQSNIKDMGFEVGDYAAIADYGMQAGLFNDIGNMNIPDMKKRVEGMAESVKLIMAVANTSSVKEAVQYMARIKAAGVTNTGAVQRVMADMGIASGVSGASVEQIMNSVGNQGQMMAQRMGMLPILGQRSAAATYAGFANAYKTGAIPTADIASLGGIEGATQLVQQAQARMLTTGYLTATMNANGTIGEGRPIENSLLFGMRRARDPAGSASLDLVNSGVTRSESVEKYGSEGMFYRGMYDLSVTTPLAWAKGTRTPDILKSVMLMHAAGKLTEEESRAVIMQVKGMNDPEYMRQEFNKTRASAERMMRQRMDQDGFVTASGVPIIGGAIQQVRHFGRSATGVGAEFGDAFTRLTAETADTSDKFMAWLNGYNPLGNRGTETMTIEDGKQYLIQKQAGIGVDRTTRNLERLRTQGTGGVNASDSDITYFLNQLIRRNTEAPADSEIKQVTDRLLASVGTDKINAGDLMKYNDLTKGDVGVETWSSPSDVLSGGTAALRYGKIEETKSSMKDIQKQLGEAARRGYRGTQGDLDIIADAWNGKRSWFEAAMWQTDEDNLKRADQVMSKDQYGLLVNDTINSWIKGGLDEGLNRYLGTGEDSFISDDFAKAYAMMPSQRSEKQQDLVDRFKAQAALVDDDLRKDFETALKNIGEDRGTNADYEMLRGKRGYEFGKQAVSRANDLAYQASKENTPAFRRAYVAATTAAGYSGSVISSLDSWTDSALTNDVTTLAKAFNTSGVPDMAAKDQLAKSKNTQDYINDNFYTGSLKLVKSMEGVEKSLSRVGPDLSGSAEALKDAAKAIKDSNNPAVTSKLLEVLNDISIQMKMGNVSFGSGTNLTNTFKGN